MKKCTKCGKECVNEHKYCPGCGTELKEVLMESCDIIETHNDIIISNIQER